MTNTANARRFGLHALVYLVSSLLVRGLTVLLTPFYTRVLSPEDFGVVAIANTLVTVLSIVMGLALYGTIPRLYHDHPTPEGRRRFLGTLFVFSALFPALLALVVEVLGKTGCLDVFGSLRFVPHLRIVVLTAVFSNFCNLPVAVYATEERPRAVSAFNLAWGIVQLGTTLLLVAVFHQGALGVLNAGLYSAALMAAVTLALAPGMASFALSTPELVAALRYALPLVPHLLANWALSVSDRLVLERYVSAAEVGRYALAYLFSTAVSLIAAALTTPLGPAANRQLGDPETARNVPPLGTFAILITVTSALLASVSARELITLLAPRAYAGAHAIVPWVVAGAAMQAFYLVLGTGTWYSKKTAAIPVVTLASAAVNVGLNLFLVPRYGILAAAVATLVGYATSAVLHGLLAHHNHPIAWEYGRWARILAASGVAFAITRGIALPNVWIAVVVKTFLALVVFGLGLLALGYVRKDDVTRALARLRSLRS